MTEAGGAGVMMCKPIVLSSGEWVLPISRWKEHDESAQCVVLADAGKTWTLRGACHVPADVGRTWAGRLMLDERPGVSYPDGQETPDGLIRIIYDYHRVTVRVRLTPCPGCGCGRGRASRTRPRPATA